MDHLTPEEIATLSAHIREARARRRRTVLYLKLIRLGMIACGCRLIYILYNLFR